MNLTKRIIVAVIFIPLIIAAFWSGGIPLGIFLGLVVILQTYELKKMVEKKHIILPYFILILSGFVFVCAAYLDFHKLLFAYVLVFFSMLMADMIKRTISGAIERVSLAVFTVSYTGLCLASIVRISHLPNGNHLILALLILIWITDTFAYFVGITIGKHRNIFIISPNKSLEGFVAGILFAFLFSFVFFKIGYITMPQALVAAFCAGFIGQFGDLFESLLKRDCQVKDSSNLIPGHGGLLDRFDSLLLAGPVYYFLLLLQG